MFAIENIAEGFADAIVESQAERFIWETIERIGGDREFCCRCHFINEDEDGIAISGGSEWKTIWASDFLGMICTFWNGETRQYEADSFDRVKDWYGFCELVKDFWDCGDIMTREEMEEETSE